MLIIYFFIFFILYLFYSFPKMPYKIHHNNKTYIMKNPFNPLDNGYYKNIKSSLDEELSSSMMIDGLKSISQSFFVWRFIFYYFIFENNHKNIYNNIHKF